MKTNLLLVPSEEWLFFLLLEEEVHFQWSRSFQTTAPVPPRMLGAGSMHHYRPEVLGLQESVPLSTVLGTSDGSGGSTLMMIHNFCLLFLTIGLSSGSYQKPERLEFEKQGKRHESYRDPLGTHRPNQELREGFSILQLWCRKGSGERGKEMDLWWHLWQKLTSSSTNPFLFLLGPCQTTFPSLLCSYVMPHDWVSGQCSISSKVTYATSSPGPFKTSCASNVSCSLSLSLYLTFHPHPHLLIRRDAQSNLKSHILEILEPSLVCGPEWLWEQRTPSPKSPYQLHL